jgi:hypothetical protein
MRFPPVKNVALGRNAHSEPKASADADGGAISTDIFTSANALGFGQ